MTVIRSMMTYAKTVSKWSHRTDPIVASAPRKMDADSGDMRGAGWSNGSSPGFNGNAAFLSAGSFIRRTSLASCNSPASRSSSNDFEIGSKCSVPAYDGTDLHAVDKDGTWARFYTGAPARRRLSVERYTIVKRA